MNFNLFPVSRFDFNNLTTRHLSVGNFIINLQNNHLWLSEKSYELLGLPANTSSISLSHFIRSFVYKEDRRNFESALNDCINTLKKDFYIQIKLLHESGRNLQYECFGEVAAPLNEKYKYLYGCIRCIDAASRSALQNESLSNMINTAEEMADIAVLDKEFFSGKAVNSKKISEIFEADDTMEWSLKKALCCLEPKSRETLKKGIVNLKRHKLSFDEELLITTIAGKKKWIRFIAKPVTDINGKVTAVRSLIQNINEKVNKDLLVHDYLDKLEAQKYFLNEKFSLAKLGGWEIDFVSDNLFWDAQTKTIHEVARDYKPDLEKAISFYTDESKIQLEKIFNKLKNDGTPYDVELQLITAKNSKVWVRTIGTPIYDNQRNIIGARGILQDINEAKLKSLTLERSLAMITKQKEKLTNFAFIVSHNLRTHTSNLKLLSQIIEQEEDTNEKLSWLNNIQKVSESLDESVNGLTEIVRSHSKVSDSKINIEFSSTINSICKAINLDDKKDVKLLTDFSACPTIESVPAYVESIMMNLVTNAIKYRHPERQPKIRIRTYFKNNRPCLEISDNGRGIDLQTYGNKLFGLNQTFHGNRDARGIGLYITKNHIENLGGTIEAESSLNIGTTFKVTF